MGSCVDHFQLVIAVGSVTNPHGVKGLENCNFLKDINDARVIRNKVISNLETACLPTTTDEERKRLHPSQHGPLRGAVGDLRNLASIATPSPDACDVGFLDHDHKFLW